MKEKKYATQNKCDSDQNPPKDHQAAVMIV